MTRRLLDEMQALILQGLAVSIPAPCINGKLNPEWVRARAANITASLFGAFDIQSLPTETTPSGHELAIPRPDPNDDDERIV